MSQEGHVLAMNQDKPSIFNMPAPTGTRQHAGPGMQR